MEDPEEKVQIKVFFGGRNCYHGVKVAKTFVFIAGAKLRTD